MKRVEGEKVIFGLCQEGVVETGEHECMNYCIIMIILSHFNGAKGRSFCDRELKVFFIFIPHPSACKSRRHTAERTPATQASLASPPAAGLNPSSGTNTGAKHGSDYGQAYGSATTT